MGCGDRATLVRLCDPAGRPRGTGFVADGRGTVVTSHEAVDGLPHLLLHGADGRSCRVEAHDITALPELDLALLPTGGPDALGVPPLPIAPQERIDAGAYVRIAAHGVREARVLGATAATYTAGGRTHTIGRALELALGTDGSDALRLRGAAVGGPVFDPDSGAVIAVLGTALRTGHAAAGCAVPLAGPDRDGPLGVLLRRNATEVPGYGTGLNVAGALQLTAMSVGSAGGPSAWPDPVERPDALAEFNDFAAVGRGGDGEEPAVVLGLVGAPGTGRTTELAALAARRTRGPVPAPTLWLRGADLLADDTSVADAIARTLRQAGRIVAAAGATGDMAAATPERVAGLAADAGSPLLVLLDGPEEMPPVLAHRLARWTAGSVDWLRAHGARLVVACRPEHWETAGALWPPDALHRPARPARRLPSAVRIGDLTVGQAERAREGYGLPPDALAVGHDRHPLTLRLLAEVRGALPAGAPGRPDTEEVFGAHLDLMCLRIAVRIASQWRPAPHGTAVRRLAARVAGQVHEAARRCLGPGQGELDRAAFEEVFPWRTGWASAVLAEGLLVPAGAGYRFAHEELGDWVQGAHLDLDAALRALVHRWHADAAAGEGADRVPHPRRPGGQAAPRAPEPEQPHTLPVPRHRIGPVIQALLLLGRRQGPAALAHRLADLIEALDRLSAGETGQAAEAVAGDTGVPFPDARWWAGHLLAETLLRVPDARPHLGVLRLLAGRIVRSSADAGGSGARGAYAEFGPWFWRRLRLPEADRMDLFRRLVPADGPPGTETEGDGDGERFLDAVARRLAAHPRTLQPLLCAWFTDERPLAADADVVPRPTVAAAAQALLHARRDLAVDDLADALVSCGHPRADELLAALAEDEPAALCRAVERWSRDDDRRARRIAAAWCGALVAPHLTQDADRALLRRSATALLARPSDTELHGPVLALLVADPQTRERYLPQALRAFVADGPKVSAAALAVALPTHPEPVLAAYRERLVRPGGGAGEALRALAGIDAPALALHTAGLVRAYVDSHPGDTSHTAAYLDRRLEQGPAARALLLPLLTGLLRDRPAPPPVRGALAGVLASPGSPASQPSRDTLLEVLLDFEQGGGHRDPIVLEALLRAAATGCGGRPPVRTRALVHRTGMLLLRTPEGAGLFDRLLVALARDVPGFGALVVEWLADAPQEWAAVIGPSARRTVEGFEGVPGSPMTMPMQAAGREHGSLRPA
ncbi:trypsin-like peptidase domain-containing protein [Streptomyces sp. P01-B04]|uniref:S1 family peptidase n=1 Tax=Streptomyces poriferorum TaxID=2798799 RepID=UPI001C5DE62E|nr:serine protease [Streptomyces poriferorum]MBW5252344.1 trypsin-like peptidase domain-containing protein [Streptomyces poriferorum]MBW5259676.1 trypsin-like peptidase domain-containing protein [Streptomyces poriferorum]